VTSIERGETLQGGARWRVRTARGHVDAEHVIVGTNAYTGAFWPGLKKTFLPSRTPQLVSRPLRDNVAKSILPDGQIMSDTRYLTVGVRMQKTAACIWAAATAPPGRTTMRSTRRSRSRLAFSIRISASWSGNFAGAASWP